MLTLVCILSRIVVQLVVVDVEDGLPLHLGDPRRYRTTALDAY